MGLVWNIFGVVQFVSTLNGTVGSMMSQGLTEAQAKLYLGLPQWMNIAFAIGVFGGVIGSVLLLLKKKLALRVFGVSLAGYIVLYFGDITLGVFEAFGTKQVVILSTVLAIAVFLVWFSKRFIKTNQLT